MHFMRLPCILSVEDRSRHKNVDCDMGFYDTLVSFEAIVSHYLCTMEIFRKTLNDDSGDGKT